jgi:hypothetical protein
LDKEFFLITSDAKGNHMTTQIYIKMDDPVWLDTFRQEFCEFILEYKGQKFVLQIDAFLQLLATHNFLTFRAMMDYYDSKKKEIKEKSMDKKITKVRKQIDKKMDALVREDKPRDKKIKACDKIMMKKKK